MLHGGLFFVMRSALWRSTVPLSWQALAVAADNVLASLACALFLSWHRPDNTPLAAGLFARLSREPP